MAASKAWVLAAFLLALSIAVPAPFSVYANTEPKEEEAAPEGEAAEGEAAGEKQPTIIDELKEKATKGDVKAQKKLAKRFLAGDGVVKNTSLAFGWYLRAAEKGDADAQYTVGEWYLKGRSTPIDFKEAAKWFEKAARMEHLRSQTRLGLLRSPLHDALIADLAKAHRWLSEAADGGDIRAERALDEIIEAGLAAEASIEYTPPDPNSPAGVVAAYVEEMVVDLNSGMKGAVITYREPVRVTAEADGAFTVALPRLRLELETGPRVILGTVRMTLKPEGEIALPVGMAPKDESAQTKMATPEGEASAEGEAAPKAEAAPESEKAPEGETAQAGEPQPKGESAAAGEFPPFTFTVRLPPMMLVASDNPNEDIVISFEQKKFEGRYQPDILSFTDFALELTDWQFDDVSERADLSISSVAITSKMAAAKESGHDFPATFAVSGVEAAWNADGLDIKLGIGSNTAEGALRGVDIEKYTGFVKQARDNPGAFLAMLMRFLNTGEGLDTKILAAEELDWKLTDLTLEMSKQDEDPEKPPKTGRVELANAGFDIGVHDMNRPLNRFTFGFGYGGLKVTPPEEEGKQFPEIGMIPHLVRFDLKVDNLAVWESLRAVIGEGMKTALAVQVAPGDQTAMTAQVDDIGNLMLAKVFEIAMNHGSYATLTSAIEAEATKARFEGEIRADKEAAFAGVGSATLTIDGLTALSEQGLEAGNLAPFLGPALEIARQSGNTEGDRAVFHFEFDRTGRLTVNGEDFMPMLAPAAQ